MRHGEEQLVRLALTVGSDRLSHPWPSIYRMLARMGFPDPEALRAFIIDTPWVVNNRDLMVYLQRLSAQGE